MELLLNAPLSKLPPWPKFCTSKHKPLAARPPCLGLERHDDLDVHKDVPQSMDHEPKEKQNDTRQLFTEAQQNILYLNKQRLVALEELDELKRENAALLDRIEQLEAKKLLNTEKEIDKLSISSELLLRIDSMVVSGLIGNREASDLRSLVMDSRMSIAANLYQITHKKDSELLVELRHFSSNSKMLGRVST